MRAFVDTNVFVAAVTDDTDRSEENKTKPRCRHAPRPRVTLKADLGENVQVMADTV